jgi:hypothetical protein
MPTISQAAHDVQYSGPVDEVAAALSWHDGDVRATIRTLLGDCRHLREKLALAEIAVSVGYTRGWRPTDERTE